MIALLLFFWGIRICLYCFSLLVRFVYLLWHCIGCIWETRLLLVVTDVHSSDLVLARLLRLLYRLFFWFWVLFLSLNLIINSTIKKFIRGDRQILLYLLFKLFLPINFWLCLFFLSLALILFPSRDLPLTRIIFDKSRLPNLSKQLFFFVRCWMPWIKKSSKDASWFSLWRNLCSSWWVQHFNGFLRLIKTSLINVR